MLAAVTSALQPLPVTRFLGYPQCSQLTNEPSGITGPAAISCVLRHFDVTYLVEDETIELVGPDTAPVASPVGYPGAPGVAVGTDVEAGRRLGPVQRSPGAAASK